MITHIVSITIDKYCIYIYNMIIHIVSITIDKYYIYL